MQIKTDRDKWSKESKQSITYNYAPEYYEDINYFCYKCGEHTIYLASEQKNAFEVEKRYIDQKRYLCKSCYKNLCELKKNIHEYEQKWKNETDECKKHAPYLKDWLRAINEIPNYGKSKNHCMAQMLFRLVNEVA